MIFNICKNNIKSQKIIFSKNGIDHLIHIDGMANRLAYIDVIGCELLIHQIVPIILWTLGNISFNTSLFCQAVHNFHGHQFNDFHLFALQELDAG